MVKHWLAGSVEHWLILVIFLGENYQFIYKVFSYVHQFSKIRVIFTHNSTAYAYSMRKNYQQKRRALDIKSKRTKSSLAQITDCASYSPMRIHLHTLIAVNRN